jgi:hypothetical protein
MSQSNGDKARFERERQKKMLRREHTQAVRKTLAVKAATRPTPTQGPPTTKATE